MSFSADDIQRALTHLRGSDPILDELIGRVGPFGLKLHRNRFSMLVRSILSQQISTKAARSIRRRVEELMGGGSPTPEKLLSLSVDDLRTAGVSGQKAGYLLDLAERVQSRQVRLARIGRLDDEEVIAELTQVKGIGRWTAQMFLIFCLGRLDVFPHDDLGVRMAIRDLYGMDALPDRETSLNVALPWRPYASVASWYCWRQRDTVGTATPQAAGYPV